MSDRERVITEESSEQRIQTIQDRIISSYNQNEKEQQLAIRRGDNINFNSLTRHTSYIANEKISNQVLLESNSMLSRAMEILVGLITSPVGGHKVILNYSVPELEDEQKYKSASEAICKKLEEHFTNNVKINNDLYEMFYTAIATDGAHITVFIPDSQMAIPLANAGLESDRKLHSVIESFNTFKTPSKNEEYKLESLISVSDDLGLLALSGLNRQLNDRKMSIGLELGVNASKSSKNGTRSSRVLHKRRVFKENKVRRIETGDLKQELYTPAKRIVGSEACRPIIFKGEANDPYGYILLLDEYGYPIEVDAEIDFDKDLRMMGEETPEEQRIKRISNNFTQTKKEMNTLDDLQEAFNQSLELYVLDSLKNKSYAKNFSIKDDKRITKIMFHRLLRKERTRILILPAELVSYIAFDVDKYGVGRSVLSKTKALTNIYTVLFYADFLSALSNAINRKEVNITFDENDPDMNKTLEQIIDEQVISSVGSFDFNANGPSDVIRNIQKHGITYKLNNTANGNLPGMDISVTDNKRHVQPIDSEFRKEVGKMTMQRIGFSSDYIDSSYSPEFSRQIARDNELTDKMIAGYTSKASDLITDRIVKETLIDPVLYSECLDLIKGENKEDVLEDILANLLVEFPKNEIAGHEDNYKSISERLRTVQLIIETVFPETLIQGLDAKTAEYFSTFKDMTTSFFMSDYISSNSTFKSVISTMRDEDGLKSMLEDELDFKELLMNTFNVYAKQLEKFASKHGVQETTETTETTPTDSTDDENDDVESTDDDAGTPTVDAPEQDEIGDDTVEDSESEDDSDAVDTPDKEEEDGGDVVVENTPRP